MTGPAAFWRLHSFETLGSTSDLCRDLARQGEPEGYAVMARRQTAGRGSRGRDWVSAPGNLFLSCLLRPADRPRDAGLWALLAGVAVAECLASADVKLKWPNDILHRGAKLGGILVETELRTNAVLDYLVIGIGLNLGSAPDLADRSVASLDGRISPEQLAPRLLDRINHWRQVRMLEDWRPIREAWLSHALPVGTAMTLRRGELLVGGDFAGLAEDGSLLLQTGGRVHAFSTGEIWLQPRQGPDGQETTQC